MSDQEQIKILAIETSADETSAAVLVGNKKTRGFKLLSNIIYSQIAAHRKTGGIVPEVAARAHIPKILPAIKLAITPLSFPPLNKGGVEGGLKNIDAVAVTAGPGLITALMIGVDTAKALAYAQGVPIIPVNHMEGHLLSATPTSSPPIRHRRTGGEREGVKFPALGLTVSGGHTMLVLLKDIGKYKILGQTLDDAAGECFDKVAKLLGLPYPGGPAISKLARKGNPRAYNFPRPMIDSKNFHFSFAGLKTAVLYFLRDHPSLSPSPSRGGKIKKYPSPLARDVTSELAGEGRVRGKFVADVAASSSPLLAPLRGRGIKGEGVIRADVAASVEQAIIDVLVTKTLRAAKEYKVRTILLGGGVSANRKLRQTLSAAVKKSLPTSDLRLPTSALTTDNAGMIAIAAFYHYLYGDVTTFDKVRMDPNWELKSWR